MGNKLGRRRHVVDEEYTKPQGLYQLDDVDLKKLRKLILDSKLAPCCPGEDECRSDLEECPICFLNYPSLNRSRCCIKGVCTECFLQMNNLNSNQPAPCPFCKSLNYAVEYRGIKTKEEKGIEQIEEQKVIEAKIRMRQRELEEEEERMLKRQEMCSSDQVGPDENGSVAVPANSSSIEGKEVSSSQDSCAASSIRRLLCLRDERYNGSDLEELMIKDAIWLSMREYGRHQNSAIVDATPSEQYTGEHQCLSAATVLPAELLSSPSGGLAGAIAALVEHQHMGGVSNGNSGGSTSAFHEMPSGSRKVLRKGGRRKKPEYGYLGSSKVCIDEDHNLSVDVVLPVVASLPPSGGFTSPITDISEHQQMGELSSGNYSGSISACYDIPSGSGQFFSRNSRHQNPDYDNMTSTEQSAGGGNRLSEAAVLADDSSSSPSGCAIPVLAEHQHLGGEVSPRNHSGNMLASHYMLPGCSRFFNMDGRHQNPAYGNATASEQYLGKDHCLSAVTALASEASSSSISGNHACTIANHADHQQINRVPSINYYGNTQASHNMFPGSSRFFQNDGQAFRNSFAGNTVQVLSDSLFPFYNHREWGMQRGLEVSEMVNEYSGFPASSEDHPCRETETPFISHYENYGALQPYVATGIPESLEDQLMLNMAVSLAEV